MATIRMFRKKWQTLIRIKGHPHMSKTFVKHEDAKRWGLETELKLIREDAGILKRTFPLFADVAVRYLGEISPLKRGYKNEKNIIKKLLREQPWTQYKLDKIKPSLLVSWRNDELKKVSADTFCRRLDVVSHIFTICRKEWDVPINNPCLDISRPKRSEPRNRRFTELELQQLIYGNHTPLLFRKFIELMLETGMRKTELLSVRPEHFKNNLLFIPIAKTKPRTIPLTPRAVELFKNVELPFALTAEGLIKKWRKMCISYGIKDAKIYDLRHQSLTNFMFEKNLSVQETMIIAGHADPRTLLRVYSNLRAEEVAKKLQN
jgi:integrase